MILINFDRITEMVNNIKDPNQQQNIFGNTLLHVVVEIANSIHLVQKLINAGADVNLANFLGITPLHCAVIHRNHSAVNLLIEFGALVNSKDFCGNTALHYAVNNNMLPVPHPNCRSLFYYNNFADKELIERLLQYEPVDVNAANDRKETPLMWAVESKELDVVKALLSKKANMNIGDQQNKTALHIALYDTEPDLDIVLELLVNGACTYCFDDGSQTPVDILVKRLSGVRSDEFTESFAKITALMQRINGVVVSEQDVNCRVLLILKQCNIEMQQMKNEVIAEKLSLFELLCQNINIKAIEKPKSNVYKKVVEILLSGEYSMYCDIILKRIPKLELCRVVVGFAFVRKNLEGSNNNYLSLFSNFIITCCISDYLLNMDMFNIIVALFIENNAECRLYLPENYSS